MTPDSCRGGVNNFDSSLVDAWIFSGHTNAEAPASITGEKGMALTCMNFAWTAESGFNGSGELAFDGVDDYLWGTGLEILEDFTVIADRTILNGTNGCTASNSTIPGGAFIMEVNNHYVYSYGDVNKVSNYPDGVTWMTPTSYNGQVLANVGKKSAATDELRIGTVREGDRRFLQGTMKYFALYRRSLSEEEIAAEVEKLEAKWNERK